MFGAVGKMIAETLPETSGDLIGAKIKQLQRIPSWTSDKRRLRDELEKMLDLSKYQGWWANPRDYRLQRVGQSFQYDVPSDKRGHLQQFRGRRIRLICMRSGRYSVWIRVGVVR